MIILEWFSNKAHGVNLDSTADVTIYIDWDFEAEIMEEQELVHLVLCRDWQEDQDFMGTKAIFLGHVRQ